MADQIIWWTGAAVLGAIGFIGAAALFAGLVGLAVSILTKNVLKIWFTGKNLSNLHAYVKAGRPEWRVGPDRVYRMVPTDGPWTDAPLTPEPHPHD